MSDRGGIYTEPIINEHDLKVIFTNSCSIELF